MKYGRLGTASAHAMKAMVAAIMGHQGQCFNPGDRNSP